MRYLILSTLAICITGFLYSCKTSEGSTGTEETAGKQDVGTEPIKIPELETSQLDSLLSCTGVKDDSLVIQIDRSPCFGRCPIYEAKIYCSGYVQYSGENFVNHLGHYESRMGREAILSIISYADSIGYWDMEGKYDGSVTDLATTTTMLHWKGKKHLIKNRYQGPESLGEFEDFIDRKLEKLSWSKRQQDR